MRHATALGRRQFGGFVDGENLAVELDADRAIVIRPAHDLNLCDSVSRHFLKSLLVLLFEVRVDEVPWRGGSAHSPGPRSCFRLFFHRYLLRHRSPGKVLPNNQLGLPKALRVEACRLDGAFAQCAPRGWATLFPCNCSPIGSDKEIRDGSAIFARSDGPRVKNIKTVFVPQSAHRLHSLRHRRLRR